jgi:hypothetical protein|tara:strand:+ start:4035 stop:4268 length:234 start_codon:yes stop_codon:yes gene_type:complete
MTETNTGVEYVPAEVVDYLIMVTLDDGCVFKMVTEDKKVDGWMVDFPNGFNVMCPHGFSDGISPIEGGTDYVSQIVE